MNRTLVSSVGLRVSWPCRCSLGLGDLRDRSAVLGGFGVGFIEPGNGMGDPRKTYGEMPARGEAARLYGEM